MGDEVFEHQEMKRLQDMHETVERLRSQLRIIQLEEPGSREDTQQQSSEASPNTKA